MKKRKIRSTMSVFLTTFLLLQIIVLFLYKSFIVDISKKNETQIASSSWTPSGRKLGLPQPLRLRKQCQGMLQRVLLECSTPDSSSEGC